jgi:glycerophosphoryl diester phosphodiesterase
VGRVFVVNVTDYDIPTGATVTCVATKPSGMGFTVSGTVSGNSVTFTSTAEMTDEWGRFPAEIRIASGNTLLGTANFLMIGEKDPHPASTIDGTQEELIPQLTLLVNRVEAAAESVHDLTVSATTLTAGSDATATYDSTNNSITFGIPRGADGDVTRSEFNDLKSDLSESENGIIHIASSKFSRGAIQTDGTINSQSYYASNNVDLQFDYPIKISVKDGYKYAFAKKVSDSSYAVEGFVTHDWFVLANTPFRLKIGRVTETWDAANLEEFSRQVNIITNDRAELLFNSAQIDKLKSGDELLDASFGRGTISNGNYLDYVKYRIATPNIVRFNKPITITADDNFRFGVQTFDSDDAFITDLGWKTSYTIEANQGFKLIVARVAASEDTSEIANVFEFYTKIRAESSFKDYVKGIISDSALLSAPILHNGKPKLNAHMGYRANAPENTTASFINAGKVGYWGIESDVQQTSDGYYVMMHDTTVDRTTNGTGNVNEMTLAQIRALQIKDHLDLKVPTFEEYLAICKWYGCVPNIEIKSTVTNSKASFEKLIGIVKSFGFDDKGVIFSGSKWAFDNFRQATETIPYMAIYQSGLSYVWATEFAFCSQYKNAGMCWDVLNGLTFENCEDAHEKDMLICAFITDSTSSVKSAFEKGADFCTTNTVLPTD